MAELSLTDLRTEALRISKKPLEEVTPGEMEIINEYLRCEDLGVSQEMLDFISSPEQQAITRRMFEDIQKKLS